MVKVKREKIALILEYDSSIQLLQRPLCEYTDQEIHQLDFDLFV